MKLGFLRAMVTMNFFHRVANGKKRKNIEFLKRMARELKEKIIW
jgi:hypothetical protein